jgi:hypothetical protein
MNRIGHVVQQIPPVVAGQIPPRREGALCRFGGCRHIAGAAGRHLREQPAVDGRMSFERFAGTRGARRTGDEVLHAARAPAREMRLRFRDVSLERRRRRAHD